MDTDTSLAERYVTAVARSVPAADRAEVSAELRASIADEVEGRIAAGEEPAAAEYAVIAELGDPIAYAASLSGRPLVLIGPRYYAAWLRLLRLLLIIVVPVTALIAGLVRAIGGGDVGAVIGSMIPAIITYGVHVAFWTTLVFAVLERVGSTGDTVLDWTPDKLPRTVIPTARLSDLIGIAVMTVLLVGSVVWDRTIGWGDQHVHVLAPGLWPWVMTAWFGLLAIGLVVEAIVAVRGRWSAPLAAVSIAASLVAMIGAIMLIWRGAVIAPELMAQMRAASTPTADVVQIVNISVTAVLGGILIGLLFDAYRKLGLAREA
ncbi:permease prefix domain 1-containing protein [uncultured Microbacterium sp.]|uniref:permease prefix domain 1-containing protein n=1 Tax=uncultured Microbacterium sp. TaxID=191216 RepID=UPI0025D0365A|nr:permease prefix domain 1-containing protein [uncultured Microbacterium sp.]